MTPEQIKNDRIRQWERETAHGEKETMSFNPLTNRRLADALNVAAGAEGFVGAEVFRLQLLLKEATNQIEKEAREYQIEYAEKYLKRAADLANKRLAHFAALKSQSDIETELERCRADKAYWFEMYAFGYDPRARTPLSVVPFDLFPAQKRMVIWLDEIVFGKRTSGLIEKARDEGATEAIVRWGIHNWIFAEGFSMLLSSRTEDEVDTKKKQGTLFERARYQIRLLPEWMLPAGFDVDRDMLADKLIAAPNGNTLVGQAPVENMGRGDRVTCAMFDEFAFWRFGGFPQFRSMSQTTDSIIMPSSVAGRMNQYADIAFDGVTPKFVMDWRENPFKDLRWYNSLPYGYISPKMSRTTIAQEVDRNYDAAQPGKVWQCPEPYVFITRSEFLKPFAEAKMSHKFFDEKSAFKIPDDWRVQRTSDYGKSEGHDWSYLLAGQPTENYPLSDTHFVFIARNLEPTGLLTAQAVALWREWERRYGLRDAFNNWFHKPFASYNSHEQGGTNKVEGEQSDLRTVLRETYGENWQAWHTNYSTGIETIEEWWTPSDLLAPNPFRPELYGRCRLVFVAPDGEYRLAYNERLAAHFVTSSDSEEGFGLARKQIGAYHYPMSELGKAVKDMRPVKDFDDIIDAIRGYSVNWNRKPVAATLDEKVHRAVEEYVPEAKVEQMKNEDSAYAAHLQTQRQILADQMIERMKKKDAPKNSWSEIG